MPPLHKRLYDSTGSSWHGNVCRCGPVTIHCESVEPRSPIPIIQRCQPCCRLAQGSTQARFLGRRLLELIGTSQARVVVLIVAMGPDSVLRIDLRLVGI